MSMSTDASDPTDETDAPDTSAEHQSSNDARRPSDRLNKDQPSTEGTGAPVRKSSLL